MASELAARLKELGVEGLLRLIAQSPRSQVLRRCAAVRSFDRALYEQVLAPDMAPEPAPPFSEVVGWSEVEAVPRRPGEFRVRDRLAAEGEEPLGGADLVRLCGAVAAFCERGGPDRSLDLLHALAVADPGRAELLFADLYARADGQVDLARCHDLLGAVAERYESLPETFRGRIDAGRAYYRARSLWSDEYYKTRMYLERPALTDALGQFVEGNGPWIANLYAHGGMGKTATIRWLISRHCVPAPRRIPVARIDFDFDSPFRLATNAPLLLLKLARQLDEQIEDQPFTPLRQHLELEIDEDSATASPSPEDYVAGLLERFAAACRQHVGPILLVFDTVEVAIVDRAELDRILLLLSRLREMADVRALFAGRYDLREAHPPFDALPGSVSIPIRPFTDEEATVYLGKRRGIDDPAMVQAIVGRSGGLPFKLSLFADIVRTTPGLTPADVLAYQEVDTFHLIRRIVKRLPDKKLHWVLRYGAIPRRLTSSFVRDVMVPLLGPAMAGKVDYDDGESGVDAADREDVFVTRLLESPSETIDVDALWNELRRYASLQSSWIAEDAAHPDTLTFHADVLNPMRRLLERQKVFSLLHERAIAHFDGLARAGGAAAAEHTRQAVYHRFQLGADDRESYWRQALDRALAARDLVGARALAVEITGPDYADGILPLERADGTPVVQPATLAEALSMEAQLLVRRARAGDRGEDWAQASVASSKANGLLAQQGRGNDAGLAVVRASLALHDGATGVARDWLDGAAAATPAQQLALDLVRFEVALLEEELGALGPSVGEARARAAALGFFGAGPPPQVLLDREPESVESGIVTTEAARQRGMQRFDLALGTLASWDALLARRGAAQARAEWGIEIAVILIEAHEPDAAAERLRPLVATTKEGPMRAPALLALARAEGAAFLPREALKRCAEVAALASPQVLSLEPALDLVMAWALATLYEVDESRIAFERAVSGFRSLGDARAAADCVEAAARVELHHFQDVAAAQKLVEEFEGGAWTRAARARMRALRVELAIRRGAGSTEPPIFPADVAGLPPAEAIALIAAAMRAAPTQPALDEWAGPLCAAVSQIMPESARPGFLFTLRLGDRTLSPAAAAGLRRLLPAATARGLASSPFDTVQRLLHLAEALRVCGDVRAAAAALRRAEALQLAERPLAGLALARIRAALREPPSAASKLLKRVRKDFADHRGLRAVALLEEAERIAGASPSRARRLLDEVEASAKGSTLHRLIADRIQAVRRAAGGTARRPARPRKRVRRKPKAKLAKAAGPEGPAVVTLSRAGKGALVHSTLFGGEAARPAPPEIFGGPLRRDQFVNPTLLNVLAMKPREVARTLYDYLFVAGVDTLGPMQDVRFLCDEIRWHAMPWEMALQVLPRAPGDERQPCFYRASLTRPVPSPDTRPAPSPRPTPLSIIVVRPSTRKNSLASRMLIAAYRAAGMAPLALDAERLTSDFVPLLRRPGGYALVHITTSLAESRSGAVVLEDGLSSGLLVKMIGAAGKRPFIVLDPPRPASPHEAWRQVLLRNCVGAELFHSGGVRGVFGCLGVGLDGSYFQCLRRGAPAGDLVARVAHEDKPWTPGRAVTLFTNSPRLPAVAPPRRPA